MVSSEEYIVGGMAYTFSPSFSLKACVLRITVCRPAFKERGMAQEQLEETTNVALNAISRVVPIPDLPDRKIFCIMEKEGVKIMTTKERKRQTPQR